MTLGTISNMEIDQILHKVPGYKGCYSDNNIPLERNRPNSTSYYVVNFQSDDEPGSHWCMICVEPNRVVFIDPYGMVPDQDMLKWIKTRKKPLFYSKHNLQALSSSRCGWYCIFFILRNAGRKGRKNQIRTSFEDIISEFNEIPGTRDNEAILEAYFTPIRLKNLMK